MVQAYIQTHTCSLENLQKIIQRGIVKKITDK